ncbi:MAG: glycosyltransferase family 4 protein [Candidatus Sumerlaeia bacterium]|nr:glycosyltransferase family 4 protein [Candidatus Sumerlaeia bacterium]
MTAIISPGFGSEAQRPSPPRDGALRVLLLSPSGRLLGARRSLVDLASRLPAGVEPLVVCPGRGELFDALRERGVPVEVVRHYPWRKFGGRLGAWFSQLPALRRAAERFAPHIVHANEYHSIPQALRSRWRPGGLGGGPCLAPAVTAHLRNDAPPAHVAKYEFARCDRIICVSDALRRALPAYLQEKASVVHNGVETTDFPLRGGAREPYGDFAPPPGAFAFGLFGLVSPRKAQLVAVEALARLVGDGIEAHMLIAGDAFKSTLEYGDELRRRIGQPDVRGRVVWLPFQADPRPLYRAVDANLLVSTEEGFGRTIIEAGATGLPSIGARIGGIPEIIVEGGTGLLVPPNDVAALAGAMRRLAETPASSQSMGLAAARRVAEQFSLDSTVARIVQLWRDTAQPPPPR